MNFFTKAVTVYRSDSTRFIVGKCVIQGQLKDRHYSTTKSTNAVKTVITKDIDKVIKAGDFIVFKVVDDNITSVQDFLNLRKKYKDRGMTVNSVETNVYGMNVDNIEVIGE